MDYLFYQGEVKKSDKKKAKGFLKTFGIKVNFTKQTNTSSAPDSIMSVSSGSDSNLAHFWSAIFHELCHILCYRDGIYKIYNGYKPKGMTRKEYHRIVRKTALRAELYVERRAERLMKEFMPTIPYERAYREKADLQCYKNWLDKYYPAL